MNVNVDFKKIYNDYAKDKIEDLGFIKANSERGEESIKGITYKLNYIDKGIREVHPAYCVSPEDFYGGEIDKYIHEQNEHLEDYFGDDPEGLILCSKEKDEYVVKYNMGQMVSPYYPMMANMTFIKVDTKFHETINEYWDELYLSEDMKAGIETELDIGNGSGDGLFKDIINVYLQMDIKYDDKVIKSVVTEFKELFDKYEIEIPSLEKLYNTSLKTIDNKDLKRNLLDFIHDIDSLSINNDKLNLRDKKTTIKPIENNLKELKKENRKKNKEAR